MLNPANSKQEKNPVIQDCVLSKVLDPFRTFTPEFLESMTTEQHSVEYQSKKPINEHVQLESVPEIPANIVKYQKNCEWKQIPKVWPSPFDDRNNYCLEQEIEGLKEDKGQDDDCFRIYFVFRFISQEIPNRLQGCSFIVQLEVGVNMVTDAVHHLPFVMRKTSGTVEVFKVVVSMMNEVMTDPHHSNQQNRAAGTEEVRQVGHLLGIHRMRSKADKCHQEGQDNESRDLRFGLILNLFDCHFLQKLFLDCAVKALLFEGESGNRIFGVGNVILGKNLPCFLFVEVMNNKQFGDILSFRHGEPMLAPRMPGNEISEVIEFVFYDPVAGGITAPELSISFFFFLHPDLRTSLDSSRWHGLSIRFHFC